MFDGWFKKDKTYKREISTALLFFWCAITLAIFSFSLLGLSPDETINSLMGYYSLITTVIFAFSTASFGLDAFTRQVIPARRG